MSRPATYLYVPGDRPNMLDRAFERGAGAVIFDLEDGVRQAHKSEARSLVAERLTRPPPVPVWVRIDTAHRDEDLAMLASGPGRFIAGVCVPKVDDANCLEGIDHPVMALIESARGWLGAAAIARHPSTRLLACGEADLVADLGMNPAPDESELLPFRAHMIAASRPAGLPPPVGPVHLRLEDSEGLDRTTHALRRLGFRSRAVVHPAQIEAVNRVMAPTVEELRWAELVLASAADGGATRSEGTMVDEAVARRARSILGDGDEPLVTDPS